MYGPHCLPPPAAHIGAGRAHRLEGANTIMAGSLSQFHTPMFLMRARTAGSAIPLRRGFTASHENQSVPQILPAEKGQQAERRKCRESEENAVSSCDPRRLG